MEQLKYIFGPLILGYFRILANLQIKKINPTIVGIAGSSGKTTLSYLLPIILETKYKVLASKGKNSETGLPLHILGITVKSSTLFDWITMLFLAVWKVCTNWERYDIYVAEMGIDGPYEPKNMQYLLKIVKPTIGVVTNVNLEHTVYFDPLVKQFPHSEQKKKLLDLIADEETRLLTSLPEKGMAVVNIDDAYIAEKMGEIKSQKMTVSLTAKTADMSVLHVMVEKHMFMMEFRYQQKNYILKLHHPLPEHFSYEFLFAIAVGVHLHIPIPQAIQAIEKTFSLPPGRMSVFAGIRNTTLIDSSYNASLVPMIDMLEFLKSLGKKKRKIAILGDMRELGSVSRDQHEEVAREILRTSDTVILIGPLMRNYAVPLLENAKFSYKSFLTFTEAKQYILDTIQEEDVILIKGSQNMLFLERVVALLLEDSKETEKLCRRGEFWDKKRAATL